MDAIPVPQLLIILRDGFPKHLAWKSHRVCVHDTNKTVANKEPVIKRMGIIRPIPQGSTQKDQAETANLSVFLRMESIFIY